MTRHSCVISPEFKGALGHASAGKYGRMFPDLPPLEIDEEVLLALGRSGSNMDVTATVLPDPIGDNPRIPAGFTFLGQFIAHDITRDPSLLHHARTGELRNFRAPRLDLEAVYGGGPIGNPYFFDINDSDQFLLGINDAGRSDDVPRNRQGFALIADSRNDVHGLISQLHLAFLKFHNAVVGRLRNSGVAPEKVFEEARRVCTWHYQWIVLHEFLPLTVGQELVEQIQREGNLAYAFHKQPFIPLEFADAAYRFGHPQIRATYALNDRAQGLTVFPNLAGARPVPSAHVLDWSRFFVIPGRPAPQASRRIAASLVHCLIDLPESITGATERPEERSLAYRDLERGTVCGLPSGESVARRLGLDPLSPQELGLQEHGWRGETPLWYYILRESEVRHNGERLGEAGGRIVAEVLIGLLEGDPGSYMTVQPDWRPTLPATRAGDFTMADLLSVAQAGDR